METLYVFLILVVVTYLVSQVIGWVCYRHRGIEESPFNWRIFLGPVAYTSWLDRRNPNGS